MEDLLSEASIEYDIKECVRMLHAFDKDRDWSSYNPTKEEIRAENILMEYCWTPSEYADEKGREFLKAEPFSVITWNPCTLQWERC